MPNVTNVRVSDWNKDGTIVKVSNVTFDDGTEVPGYDLPDGIEAGKPLPDGWDVATSKSGKPYIKAPKTQREKKPFQVAWANTAEGAAFVQERTDRRTALMQAVLTFDKTGGKAPEDILDWAGEYYEWLRDTADRDVQTKNSDRAAVAGEALPPATSPASTSVAHAGEGVRAAAGNREQGSGNVSGEAASGPCSHQSTSPLKLDGQALPKGFVRCIECNTLSDKQGVFK